jgi:hypothetical protein
MGSGRPICETVLDRLGLKRRRRHGEQSHVSRAQQTEKRLAGLFLSGETLDKAQSRFLLGSHWQRAAGEQS